MPSLKMLTASAKLETYLRNILQDQFHPQKKELENLIFGFDFFELTKTRGVESDIVCGNGASNLPTRINEDPGCDNMKGSGPHSQSSSFPAASRDKILIVSHPVHFLHTNGPQEPKNKESELDRDHTALPTLCHEDFQHYW